MTPTFVLSGMSEASKSRNRLGLSPMDPIDDVLKLVREDGLVVFTQPAGADSADGMFADYRGYSFAWINSSKPAVRERFTIAHEYGHYLFHDPGLTVDEDVFRGGSVAEKRANVFAAEFLAPAPGIIAWLERHHIDTRLMDLGHVVRLGSFFGVSAETAVYRLRNSGCLSEQAKTKLLEAIQAGQHKKVSAYLAYGEWEDSVMQARAEPSMPPEMQEAVWRLYQDGFLSIERVASLLRADVSRVRKEAETHGIEPEHRDDDDGDDDLFRLS
jgi:Zn-dependent peptidase ImmA (M78 family)